MLHITMERAYLTALDFTSFLMMSGVARLLTAVPYLVLLTLKTLCKASHNVFKLVKQNLNIKHMLGCSENAVKIHLWAAVISYLLLARVKAVYDSPYSISEIATLIKVCALRKIELKALVAEPQPLIQNQDVNELTLLKKIKASVVIFYYVFIPASSLAKLV